jgi:eukaryotic-like serine/threonine-protein kinase
VPAATATKAAAEPIPGYKLVKRIGAGGYGEVWAAEAPGQLVKAIKFVYGLLDEDRAARELKALNRIRGVRHPFLLSLERIEVVDGQLLIVTELADCCLKDRYDEHRKKGLPGVPRDELLTYMRDTADALDYMSVQHSLQHLDVKPENLLMLGGRVKVADFGLVKDIHDATVSMMGGLTPIYAPPEVFEGRPSRRSDQYSLAIVYQEMLTGVLPFPGRTAAQLAAQHLNAKPKLDPLPINDQEVIARALAKKPSDRFGSCVELVNALVEAGKRSPGESPAGAVTEPAQVASGFAMTAPRLPAEMLANLDATTSAVQRLATNGQGPSPTVTRPPRPSRATSSAQSSDASGPEPNPAPELDILHNSPALLDVPPPEFDASVEPFRPTLFVGLGGCGAKVLRRLRRRFDDRLPPTHKPLVPMLLLDTDSRDISAAAHGAEGGNLKPDETLAIPLRRSQDYKEDSRRILEWLSRRWLFNIPRSLQTEGLRPLGRLAFVDHAQAVTQRLQQAIEKLYHDAAQAQLFPRVVIVASPSGGTGGGMVTDVAMLARQIAEELPEGAKMEVMAALVHGTNRNPQQQELAGANTVATLTELAQFHRPNVQFPGDQACGLKAREAGSGPLDAAYLIHAGDELSAEQIDGASEQVAEFLMLDTTTGAGNLLEACRLEIGETPGLRLRSFGLHQFGFAHDKLIDDSVSRICRSIVQRLIGPQATDEPKRTSILLRGGNIRSSDQAPPDPLADLDERAATLVRTMGLDVDPLLQVVQQFAAADLGGDAEAFFKQLMVVGPRGEPATDRWLASAELLFGESDPDAVRPRPGELAVALEEHSQSWVPQVGTGLKEWIERIIDDPHCRVTGARRAAKWLQGYLRGLAEKLVEAKTRFARESATPLQVLRSPEAANKGQKRSPQELSNAFLLYCRVRLYELAAQRAGKLIHALQSHIVAAHDVLVDLQRDLDHLASEFAAPAADAPGAARGDDAALRTTIITQLRSAEPEMALQIEEQLTKELFARHGGLQATMTAGGDAREKLIAAIRSRARQAALAKVVSIDLGAILLAADGGESQLAKCLQQAQPWLERCGGRRRLVFVIPQQLIAQYSPTTLVSQLPPGTFTQLPGVAAGAAGDLVVLYELGNVSLAHTAAHLIGFRRDLAEAASRLQTRSDVTWTPVFTF